MDFTEIFLAEVQQIAASVDRGSIEKMAALLVETRESGGRLFILGVGGSAANASHAVNDFRKIALLEAYAPTDNVSELTARTNDEGWPTVFEAWLRLSRLRSQDAVFVLSVGGGNREKQISQNLVCALEYAKSVGAKILAIVGRDGGYAAKVADACVLIPTVEPGRITPHTEAFQAVIWHLLVSHPAVKIEQTKWESQQAGNSARRAVFLDRDGVLNRAVLRDGLPYPPRSLEELEIVPGAAEGLARLKEKGFLLLVASNQPDVSRGTQDRQVVEAINERLRSELRVDDLFICYHDDNDACACRKPRPGLFTRAASRYDLNLRKSYSIGDRWRDVEAGSNAGCKTVLIDFHYPEQPPRRPPDATVPSLAEAVEWILRDSDGAPR
jgi:D-sedoheptulose 7-phosphate isomerase